MQPTKTQRVRKYCWHNLFLLLTDFNIPLEIQGFVILVNYVPLIHSFQVLLPTGFRHKTLRGFTQVTPSKLKAHKLSEKQVNEMRNWRAMYGQSVPQKTVRNMTTKDNPINLYARYAAHSLCSL